MTTIPKTVPDITVDPRAVSADFLLLARLNTSSPTSLRRALEKILKRYPGYTGLCADPDKPTKKALDAWRRIEERGFARLVQEGEYGYVLTAEGERQSIILWDNQVVSPYLRKIEHDFGRDVAVEVARRMRGKDKS